jgi:hypothetical protein
MTIPKNKSRITEVDGVRYRWTVIPDRVADGSWVLTFLAHEDRSGLFRLRHARQPKLEVVVHEAHCASVTSAVATALIRGGRQRGWDPRGKESHAISADAAIELVCSVDR